MPIYEYCCQACGAELEKLQKISDPPLSECPDCGKPALVKRVSAPSFRLKGTGWYETDFKTGKKSHGTGGDSGDNSGSNADNKGSSTGAEGAATGAGNNDKSGSTGSGKSDKKDSSPVSSNAGQQQSGSGQSAA